MGFDWDINQLAIKACEFVTMDKWEKKNASDMILCQIECYYMLAQIYIDKLLGEKFEIGFQDDVRIEEEKEEEEEELTPERKKEILQEKKQIIDYYLQGLKLAALIDQT